MDLRKIYTFLIIFALTSLYKLSGQTLPPPSLSVELLTDIVSVDIGGSFQINGRIIHDVNSSNITSGTQISYSVKITNKNGTEIRGLGPVISTAGLGNGANIPFSATFTMPWSEDDIWGALNDQWTATVVVESPGASGDTERDSFTLNICDLTLSIDSPTTAKAGDYVDIKGKITNNSPTAQSETAVYFRIDAEFPSSTGVNSILFPTQSLVDSTIAWPVQGASSLDFTIPNVYIPETLTTGNLNLTLRVDKGGHIIEADESTASNSVVHSINIVSGAADIDAFIHTDAAGTYQGLDAINLRLNLINSGDHQVLQSDTFNLTVALSQDITFSENDFILREIDIAGGGNPIGLGLKPNETITLDWVQLLPDNFEGDYYFIISENRSRTALFSSLTPVVSLRSENSINTDILSGGESSTSGRPSVSGDGKMVAFESFQSGVNQILVQNLDSEEVLQVTKPVSGGLTPNGSSFAPSLSSNGRYLVFHSMASNLVPDDHNGHSDIFLYNLYSQNLSKVSNSFLGSDTNGGSFYPSISADGSVIVFESEATNLTSNSKSSTARQIHRFEQNFTNSSGILTQITDGNNDSFDASVDSNGTLIVFTTHATNLIDSQDTNKNPDVILWDNRGANPMFYYAGLTQSGVLPQLGATQEAVISSDGSTLAFQSSSADMVVGKGLSSIQIVDAGLGYTSATKVQINDINGSGASVSVTVNSYGEITNYSIDSPGQGYVDPILSLVPDPQAPQPTRVGIIKALLVNPNGDIFKISVNSVVGKNGGSIRISESFYINESMGNTGGNHISREPTINSNGSRIAFSSLASNLLDNNYTSTNQKMFLNTPFRSPQARAILHGGIGKIEILQEGSGYPANGNLLVEDLTGSGSGAVASYLSDNDGRIIAITIQNPGLNYDLSKTIVTVQNANGGSGFVGGDLKFQPITGMGPTRTGGGTINRIEMVDSGIGYSKDILGLIGKPSFLIDGDGKDNLIDNDSNPDAKINPDRIHVGIHGEIYLEQHFKIEVLNPNALLGSTLLLSDKDREIVIQFGEFSSPPFIVSVDQTASKIIEDIREKIDQQWTEPATLLDGPQTDYNVGESSLIFKALSGKVISETSSALTATPITNMLIQGTGFSRATVQIAPVPVIYGYSEVSSAPILTIDPNGRKISQFQDDLLTDDIYVYDEEIKKNYRISLTKFGYPANYLVSTRMPSNRFPSLSSDGRHIFYSSDADGAGGLIFGNSNQISEDNNQNRDIFYRDLKTIEISQNATPAHTIQISSQLLKEVNNEVILNSNFPVYINASLSYGSIVSVNLYVNNIQVSSITNSIIGSREISQNISWENNGLLGSHILKASVIDNLENEYFSDPIEINVIKSASSIIDGKLFIEPSDTNRTLFVGNPIFVTNTDPLTGSTSRAFNGSYEVTGPNTEEQVKEMINNSEISNLFLATGWYNGQTSADAKSFLELYPFRTLVTSGSTISARALFLEASAKQAQLKKVIFYLNGQKYGNAQTEPPFYIDFIPPSINPVDQNPVTTWDLTAVAVDLNDKYFIVSAFGNVEFAQAFPSFEIDLVNSLSGPAQNDLLDGQVVTLRGTVTGGSTNLQNVKSVHFLVNGFPISKVIGNPVISSSGTFKYIDFETLFEVEFEKYAKPDGSISIYGLVEMEGINGHIPFLSSNIIDIKISEPIPWINENSSLLTIYEDITGNAPNSDEISFAIEKADSSSVATWINSMTEGGVLSDRIDIVGAHRVIYGFWHPEYTKFVAATNDWAATSGNSPEWLKSYIDFELQSGVYKYRYGIVPFLVGDYSSSPIVNFLENRHKFIERSFKNKYVTNPNLQQLYQASYKMLLYWTTYESDYWEFTGTNNSTAVDSPARRDSVGSGSNAPVWDPTINYGPSVVVSLNRSEYRSSVAGAPRGSVPTTHPNWTYLRTLGFENGEVAVDLVYSLAKEITDRGTPYILGTDPYRATYFKIATLMHVLWQGNADPLTDTDITPLLGLSTTDIIQNILNDYRYTKRFNLIWQESEQLGDNLPNWKKEYWFGNFMDQYFPWVYHEHLEWIYLAGVSQSRFWFFNDNLGWAWTGSAYFPYLYSAREKNWIYFDKANSLYYSYATHAWKSF